MKVTTCDACGEIALPAYTLSLRKDETEVSWDVCGGCLFNEDLITVMMGELQREDDTMYEVWQESIVDEVQGGGDLPE